MEQPKILVLNGPNIDMLGVREPELYGLRTMAEIERSTRDHALNIGLNVDFRQTNHEGVLIEWVHEAREGADGIVINAAALARTSLALHDAILAAERPTVEIHITNIFKRASYRPPSFLSHAANGVITGFGWHVYVLGLDAVAELVRAAEEEG